MKHMMSVMAEMQDLTEEQVPCYSRHAAKDKPQLVWTKDGLMACEKALTKQIGNFNAERVALKRALSRYMGFFNNCCDAKYRLNRYRKELKAIEVLRDVEEKDRIKGAVAVINTKMEHTKGFKERQAKKEAIKRKEPSSLEATKAGVWDML